MKKDLSQKLLKGRKACKKLFPTFICVGVSLLKVSLSIANTTALRKPEIDQTYHVKYTVKSYIQYILWHNVLQSTYCIQTLTRHSWIHYTDCWIVK